MSVRVLAVNGSPRGKGSCTHKMLEPLLEGMQDEGAETELINLVDYKIGHCIGCFACWLKTPGHCVLRDDMAALLERLITFDFLILGTPLYLFTVSGLMKNFMDRLVPLAEPFFIESQKVKGLTSHPTRHEKPKKLLIVSPCGLPEVEHFKGLIETFNCFARTSSMEYLGEILRPAGELLRQNSLIVKMFLLSYFRLLRKAGRELIKNGVLSDKLKADLLKDLIPGGKKAYTKAANNYFKKTIEKLNKK